MSTKTDEKALELQGLLIDTTPGTGDVSDLMRMNYRLSDAIREGSTVSEQAFAWGDGEQACALHAGVIAAKARGYMK